MLSYPALLAAISAAFELDAEPHQIMAELNRLVTEMRHHATAGGFTAELQRCLDRRSPGDINELFQLHRPRELPEDNPLSRATG